MVAAQDFGRVSGRRLGSRKSNRGDTWHEPTPRDRRHPVVREPGHHAGRRRGRRGRPSAMTGGTAPNTAHATPQNDDRDGVRASIRAPPREELHMATDYDASRKTEDELKEESLETRRLTSGEHDKRQDRWTKTKLCPPSRMSFAARTSRARPSPSRSHQSRPRSSCAGHVSSSSTHLDGPHRPGTFATTAPEDRGAPRGTGSERESCGASEPAGASSTRQMTVRSVRPRGSKVRGIPRLWLRGTQVAAALVCLTRRLEQCPHLWGHRVSAASGCRDSLRPRALVGDTDRCIP